jgi:hypothetical protein
MKERSVFVKSLFLSCPASPPLLLLLDDCFGQPAFVRAAPDTDHALDKSMSSWHTDGEDAVDGSIGSVA